MFRLIIFLCFFCVQNGFCQLKSKTQKATSKTDTICHYKFLELQVKYFRTLFLPVIVEGDTLRIRITGDDLYKYLSASKNNQYDTCKFFDKVFEYLNRKDFLVFNRLFFESFVKDGKYSILEKNNPYLKEIKKKGLNNLIKKVFDVRGTYIEGYTENYQLTSKLNFFKVNEYNLTYLEEALFSCNFLRGGTDVGIEFVRFNFCSPEYIDVGKYPKCIEQLPPPRLVAH